MSVGTTVQTISAMLLPWVCGGRSVSRRLAPVADDRPDDQALDERGRSRPRSGRRCCTARGSWRPARSPRPAGRGSVDDALRRRPMTSTGRTTTTSADDERRRRRSRRPWPGAARAGGARHPVSSTEWLTAPGRGASTDAELVASAARGRTAAMIPGASRVVRRATVERDRHRFRVRATMPPMRIALVPIGRRATVAAGLRALGWLASRRPVAAHGPVPTEPPTLGHAAPRLDVRAAADARDRRRRWSGGCWAVRRVDAAHPAQPGAAPPDGRVRRRRCSRSRSRCCRGSSATTRRCSRSTWSSTSC